MTVEVNGRTRLAGVVGWPLEHTLSPAMHNAAYEAMRLNAVYVPLPVRNETELARLVSAIKVLPFMGFNVTMPFKQALMPLCDEVAALAELAGAVNTVHWVDGRLIGYNTDGRGLLESLEADASFTPEAKRVVLLGAGGAAAAAFAAFVVGKAARVAVVNRDVVRAEALVARLSSRLRATEAVAVSLSAGAEAEVRAADLVVNATPVGMHREDPSPIPASWLNPGQVVADMVYRPAVTALMREAEAAGARSLGGLGMLVSQGATAVDIWSGGEGVRAPRDIMRAAAEAALAAESERAGESRAQG